MPDSFEAMVALFRRQSEARLAHYLTDDVRLLSWAPPRLALAAAGLPKDVPLAIARSLEEWTGQKWQIEWQTEGGQPTLRETELARLAALEAQMRADPTVAALMAAFPDAELSPLKQTA
jgi:DNA polymerase-3 subunit gamma/tau